MDDGQVGNNRANCNLYPLLILQSQIRISRYYLIGDMTHYFIKLCYITQFNKTA